MNPIIEKEQNSDASYALYRGKPGTPLEQARRYSYMRPATIEEFYNTVDGFIEYYKLGEEIKEAEKKTYRAHGGNYDMLMSKVSDLEEQQSEEDARILENKTMFRKPTDKKRNNYNSGTPGNNILAVRLREVMQK